MAYKLENLNFLQASISGYGYKNESGEFIPVITGLVNEEGITEGTKRVLVKISKKIKEEADILEELIKSADNDQDRIKEVSEIEVTLEIKEKILFSKIEDLSFKNNYIELYKILCSDYE